MNGPATSATPQAPTVDHDVTVRLGSGHLLAFNALLQSLANDGFTPVESAPALQVVTTSGETVTGALVSYFKMTLHIMPVDRFGPAWQPVLVPLGDVVDLTVR